MVQSFIYIILGLLALYIKTETLNGITLLNIIYYHSYQEKNYELTFFEGEEFAFKFKTNPSTGYGWIFLNQNILDDNIQLINRTKIENTNPENLVGEPEYYYIFFKAINQTTQPKILNFVYKREWEEETLTNITVNITVFKDKCKNSYKFLNNLDLSEPKFFNIQLEDKDSKEYFYLTVKEDVSSYYYIYGENDDDSLGIELYDNIINCTKELSNKNLIFSNTDKIILSIANTYKNTLSNFYVLKLGNKDEASVLNEGEILAFQIDPSENKIIKNIKTIIQEKDLPMSIYIKLGINKDFGNKLSVFGENLSYKGFYYKSNSNIDKITILSSIGESQIIPVIIKMCILHSNIIEISENKKIALNKNKYGIYKISNNEFKIKIGSKNGVNIFYYYIYLTNNNKTEFCFNSPKYYNYKIFVEKDSDLNLTTDLDLKRKSKENNYEDLYLFFSSDEDSDILIGNETIENKSNNKNDESDDFIIFENSKHYSNNCYFYIFLLLLI